MYRLMTTVAALALLSSTAMASDVNMDSIKELASSKIKNWVQNAAVLGAVKSQNQAHNGLAQADIDKLDKTWRAETKASSQPMISKILGNDLSAYLSGVKEGGEGLYTEIFVMDNKGLNVGQSDVTSDYWQGDEAKFKKSFGMGSSAIHVSEVEFDESTQTYQVQVSLPVVDAGQPIGAVTVGLNAEAIQ